MIDTIRAGQRVYCVTHLLKKGSKIVQGAIESGLPIHGEQDYYGVSVDGHPNHPYLFTKEEMFTTLEEAEASIL